MSPALYQVDAFAGAPFSGNPAAICLLPSPREPAWMQQVAAEMNLSETAFLCPRTDGGYDLRWFTPTHEVDLCGHATLASAHVLWTEGLLAPDAPAHFHTQSGELTARRVDDWIQMDFPADPVTPAEPPPRLLDALDLLDPAFVGRSSRDYLVRAENENVVDHLEPNFAMLAQVDTRGVIVTAASSRSGTDLDVADDAQTSDFVSRFFAPAVGISEDPVTGSAHCALGPYWAHETGRTSLTGRQISARSGTVRVHLDDPDAERVTLAGQATTTLQGRLVV